MIMSIRFCLSYNPLKWDFIARIQNDFLSVRNRIVDIDVVIDVRTKVLLHMLSYDFYERTLSTG